MEKELYGPHGHIEYLSSVNFNKNPLGEIQKRCKHNSILRSGRCERCGKQVDKTH